MSAHRDFPGKTPFELRRPAYRPAPFLFNSPHAGRHYPPAFLEMSCLDKEEIRLSEDRYVDLLFDTVTNLGASFMVADFPRAYLDVNREAFELDPAMFDNPLPDFIPYPTVRVQSGLGCIPRIVALNKAIYTQKLPVKEALERIYSIYRPYHEQLRNELDTLKNRFGYAVLIDCHSMPGQLRCYDPGGQPDIILGDLYGRTCSPALTHYATLQLTELGYHVGHNHPYAGGYITTHYGRPATGCHALQIEINRDLYLDPLSFELTDGFYKLKQDLASFAHALTSIPAHTFLPGQYAAE